ncbi:MAG: RNA polymerase sigma factor [Nannocystaceae bacterium]
MHDDAHSPDPRRPTHDDAELKRWIMDWRDGDDDAGRRVYDALASDVTTFLRNKAYDKQIVEDLVQDTFIKVRSAISSINTTARGYVLGVAYNTLCHHIRGRQRGDRKHRALGAEVEVGAYVIGEHELDPEYILGLKRERKLLMKALRRIPLDDQVVIELYYLQGLSRVDIAEILDVPVGTMAGRLRRGRKRLSDKIVALESSLEVLASTSKSFSAWLDELAEHLERMKAEPRGGARARRSRVKEEG